MVLARVDGRTQRSRAFATTTALVAPSATSRPDRFDERALVESARRDPNAFAELYRRYVDRIYRYAMRRSNSTAIAEDVTSATFEKALRGLASYRWREPGIGPWLFRIASNELVDVYRRDDRQRAIASSLADQPPPASFDASELADVDTELLAALAQIRPRYQRALMLRYFADLTNEEAAAAMGVSRSTMAVVLHRGAAALRKQLERSRQEVLHDR